MANTYKRLHVWDGYSWVEVAAVGGASHPHFVSTTAPKGTVVGELWINPAEMVGTVETTDILEAIRGQVIAPKAIDLDGPNTLYISQDSSGQVKLSIRADSAKGGKIDNFFATENWVLQNSSSVFVGTSPPANTNGLWVNPTQVSPPSGTGPVVVGETAPTDINLIWINPKA